MNRTRIDNLQTNPDAIDNILAAEEELIPSSGFLALVMERVHDEARMPSPIAFPWKRAVPGILLAAGVFGWGAYQLVREAIPAARSIALSAPHLSASLIASLDQPLEQAGWGVALALVVSLASWLLSRRLAGQR